MVVKRGGRYIHGCFDCQVLLGRPRGSFPGKWIMGEWCFQVACVGNVWLCEGRGMSVCVCVCARECEGVRGKVKMFLFY